MNKKKWIMLSSVVLIICTLMLIIKFRSDGISNSNVSDISQKDNDVKQTLEIKAQDEIYLQDIDGRKKNYVFKYNGKEYNAIYTKDNWHIINSFEITNENDISKICQALINIHPIHGNDMTSYRTVEDLTFEWIQHNMVYNLLSEDNSWKNNVKDVDLDPADQGKTIIELYKSRTGK